MSAVSELYERDGFLVVEKAIPEHLIDQYLYRCEQEHGDSLEGWGRSDGVIFFRKVEW